MCTVALAGIGIAPASAVTILFDDFSSTAGLTLNGNAAQAGNVLRVTPEAFNQSGSVFSSTAIPLTNANSFSTFFQFRISTPTFGIGDGDGIGADGIVFVVLTVANNVGGAGGGIGYSGIPNSVGVEFDTFNNGLGLNDPDGNHVGIDLGGNFGPFPAVPFATRFNNGAIWNAWVDYNGASHQLDVRVGASATRPAAPFTSANVDLSTVLGSPNAFVGFTSGTGAGVGNHDILHWEFRDTFSPIDGGGGPGAVPEPGTLLLLAGAALGLAVRRRRRAA
jgi:hypothetical protein